MGADAPRPLIIPGGQRCGSTWLASYLDSHPRVSLARPRRPEPKVFLVQEALPHLRASAHPAIINMVTAGIYTGGGWMSMYLAAKSAMAFFTRSMAMELAGDNIRVNAIAPGTVATDMVRNNPDEVQQAMVDAQLIKRMADPDEMVPAAAFLASDASSFMTGQVMVLDGGMTNH